MIIALSITLYIQQQSYAVPGLHITKSQINEFTELAGQRFKICDMDTDKCFIIDKTG